MVIGRVWAVDVLIGELPPHYLQITITRPLGYERVYLPLYTVADTPFHIKGEHTCV